MRRKKRLIRFRIKRVYERRSGIYQILNTKNGRIYVGKTTDFLRRYYQHQYGLEKGLYNNLLQLDYDKYGPKVFVFSMLKLCGNIDKLHKYEGEFIRRIKPAYNRSKIHMNDEAIENEDGEMTIMRYSKDEVVLEYISDGKYSFEIDGIKYVAKIKKAQD